MKVYLNESKQEREADSTVKYLISCTYRALAFLIFFTFLPVFACGEALDIAAESADNYEYLESYKARGNLKEIDVSNDFLSPELREAISDAVVRLPSVLTDVNGGFTAMAYEVVSVEQDGLKTVAALNLFSMSYVQEQEHLYLIRREAEPWRLTFELGSDDGSLLLSAVQTPWDTVDGTDFGYEAALDMYWNDNSNSYPGLAVSVWLKIDEHVRSTSNEQNDSSDIIVIQQNTVPDNLLQALDTTMLPVRVRPTWPHGMFEYSHGILVELIASNEQEYTIRVLSLSGEVVDIATFILHEDASLSFVTAFSSEAFAQSP